MDRRPLKVEKRMKGQEQSQRQAEEVDPIPQIGYILRCDLLSTVLLDLSHDEIWQDYQCH